MQLPEGLLHEELMWKVQGFLRHPTAEIMRVMIDPWEDVVAYNIAEVEEHVDKEDLEEALRHIEKHYSFYKVWSPNNKHTWELMFNDIVWLYCS